MIYRLIVLNGPLKGERITVDPEPMTVGRDEQNDIQLPDNEVALKHAQIEHRGDELFIHDLGSMNKVILNKREVQDTRLKHGDIIELGRTRLLVQAVVQAEVQQANGSPNSQRRRGRKRKVALAASVLLMAGATWSIWSPLQPNNENISADDKPVEPTLASEPVPETPPADAATESKVTQEVSVQPIDNELRQIREDLSFIHEHLKNFNNSAPSTELLDQESERPENTEIADIPIDDVESVMTAVRAAMEAQDFSQADLMLEHLQIEHPDYLPAYEARAELYETSGMPAKARDQWSAILQRTTESDLYRKAVVERIRLGRMESQRLISAHEAVRIHSIEQIRFQETAEYDEMRMVKVHLNYDRNLGPIDPQGVRLLVYFFEQDMDTDRVELSKLQPYIEANLSALQNESRDQYMMSVSYVVPKGYYDRDHNTSRQRYFGFIARLHYFDRLVDEQARPPKLLEPAILEAAGLAIHTANNDAGAALKATSN
jgi:hypothetical protein